MLLWSGAESRKRKKRVGVVGIWGNFVIGDLEGMKGTEEMKNHGDKLVSGPRQPEEEAWKSFTTSRDLIRAWPSFSYINH